MGVVPGCKPVLTTLDLVRCEDLLLSVSYINLLRNLHLLRALKILFCLLAHFVWFYGLAFLKFSPNALVVLSLLHLQLHL